MVYEGRKHKFFTYDKALKKALKNMEINELSPSQLYLLTKKNFKGHPYVGDMMLTIYVDDKEYDYEMPDVYDSIKIKYKNNVNSSEVYQAKSQVPCFSFEFKKSSGLDSGFIKALKDYFKNQDNWIKFTICPSDIKYVDTSFYREHLEKLHFRFPLTLYWKKRIKKRFKTNGDKIEKITLYGANLNSETAWDDKVLKWDKKYAEGRANLKKDFHASLSGNYIVITGQGNYTGTIIVNSPYKNEYYYYYHYMLDVK